MTAGAPTTVAAAACEAHCTVGKMPAYIYVYIYVYIYIYICVCVCVKSVSVGCGGGKAFSKVGEQFVVFSRGRSKKDAAALMHQGTQFSLHVKDQRRVQFSHRVRSRGKGHFDDIYFCVVIRALTNTVPFTLYILFFMGQGHVHLHRHKAIDVVRIFTFRTSHRHHIDFF